MSPRVFTLVSETWISLILITSGSLKLIYAFQSRSQGGFAWKLLLSGQEAALTPLNQLLRSARPALTSLADR